LLLRSRGSVDHDTGRAGGADAAEAASSAPKRSKVHVIVFDGDTGAPVRNADVHVGRFGGHTNYHGVAKIRIARHTRLR
jgi:hypothetical protein